MRSKIVNWLENLRFPFLLLIAAALFLVDLVVPDVLPFVDEALLAILTVTLARIRRKPARPDDDADEGGRRP